MTDIDFSIRKILTPPIETSNGPRYGVDFNDGTFGLVTCAKPSKHDIKQAWQEGRIIMRLTAHALGAELEQKAKVIYEELNRQMRGGQASEHPQ